MVFLYGVSLVDPMILRSGHFFRTPTTSAARWTGRGPWPNASAGCVQSWNFTMTCSWQLWQVFCKKIEGRCQIPFVRKCHWDFEILQWLEAFPCFFNQFTSIPSSSGIVSIVSTSVLHQFRQAAKEIRLKLVRHMGLAPGPDRCPSWLRSGAQRRGTAEV